MTLSLILDSKEPKRSSLLSHPIKINNLKNQRNISNPLSKKENVNAKEYLPNTNDDLDECGTELDKNLHGIVDSLINKIPQLPILNKALFGAFYILVANTINDTINKVILFPEQSHKDINEQLNNNSKTILETTVTIAELLTKFSKRIEEILDNSQINNPQNKDLKKFLEGEQIKFNKQIDFLENFRDNLLKERKKTLNYQLFMKTFNFAVKTGIVALGAIFISKYAMPLLNKKENPKNPDKKPVKTPNVPHTSDMSKDTKDNKDIIPLLGA